MDASWDPLDILVFVNRIAMSWASQLDLAPAGREHEAFLAARREAIVKAVQRLFPATGRTE